MGNDFGLGSGGLEGLGFQQPPATLSSWARYLRPKRSAQGCGESQHLHTLEAACRGPFGSPWLRPTFRKASPVVSRLQLSQTCGPGLVPWQNLQSPVEYLLRVRPMLGTGTLRCSWLICGQEEAQLTDGTGLGGQQGRGSQLHLLRQKGLHKRES